MRMSVSTYCPKATKSKNSKEDKLSRPARSKPEQVIGASVVPPVGSPSVIFIQTRRPGQSARMVIGDRRVGGSPAGFLKRQAEAREVLAQTVGVVAAGLTTAGDCEEGAAGLAEAAAPPADGDDRFELNAVEEVQVGRLRTDHVLKGRGSRVTVGGTPQPVEPRDLRQDGFLVDPSVGRKRRHARHGRREVAEAVCVTGVDAASERRRNSLIGV